MKFRLAQRRGRAVNTRAFTLAEVLAAMVFMAIVIPVALKGIGIASRAGEVAQRKLVAARIGTKVINELKVTGRLASGSQRGSVVDHGLTYTWAVASAPWTVDPLAQMIQATVTVTFLTQNQPHSRT